jgi:hypothetical protein
MVRTVITVMALAVLLSACSKSDTEPMRVAVLDACPGGAVRPVCLSQTDMCVTPYPDAGKKCSDSSQCAGDCLIDMTTYCDKEGRCTDPETPEPGTKSFGVCELDNDPCGSRIEIVNGIAQPVVHID